MVKTYQKWHIKCVCMLYQAPPDNNNELKDRKEFRRSRSVGDLYPVLKPEPEEVNNNVSDMMKGLGLTDSEIQPRTELTNNFKKASSHISLNKDKTAKTSVPRLTRNISEDYLTKLAQPKYRYSSAEKLEQTYHVPTAEAVWKFQNSTPTRFRTKLKDISNCGCALNKLGPTILQPSALMTKGRHRPITAVFREALERLELKIQAHPLNKRILQGPLKPPVPVEKKPAIQPFKKTVLPQKIAQSSKKDVNKFHAQPVPKAVYEPPKLKKVQKMGLTVPQTPAFMRHMGKQPPKPQDSEERNKPTFKPTMTVSVPFSFEIRDKIVQKRKEQFIKKIFEEKKPREFHAQPVPKAVLKTARNANTMKTRRSKSMECLSTQFKARPPTVLYKKPFEPKKERCLMDIQLNMNMRVSKWEKFEQKKANEERHALEKQRVEAMKQRQAEEEIARIRREAEYKAQPIKKYKAVKIQPSGKVTVPITPNFRCKANKENWN